MPNANDRHAPETDTACLASGWLAASGRSLRRWIGGAAPKPAPRRRSSDPYRPPAWE